MSTGPTVIDTPEGIRKYRRAAIIHGLALEIKMNSMGIPPTACPTRGRALHAAKQELEHPGRITRVAAYHSMIDRWEDWYGEPFYPQS